MTINLGGYVDIKTIMIDITVNDTTIHINVYSFFAPVPEATPIAELPVFMGFSAVWT